MREKEGNEGRQKEKRMEGKDEMLKKQFACLV